MVRKHRGRRKTKGFSIVKFGKKPQTFFLAGAIVIIIVIAIITIGMSVSTSQSPSGETYTRACLLGTQPGNPSNCLPDSMFRELPPVPNDFWPVMTLVKSGKVADICGKINESYWKQPEMLPTFYSTGIPSMLAPGKGETIMGYGAFPAEVLISIDPKKDNVIRSCFFVAAGWRVSRYQGMKLVPAYPNNISLLENRFPDGTQGVIQDSEMNKKYFHITVTPEHILLEPAWGYFYYGWIQKINIVVTVDPDTPPGKYIIGVNPAGPDKDLNQEWLWQYKTLYVPVGLFGLDRPFYSIGVEVG